MGHYKLTIIIIVIFIITIIIIIIINIIIIIIITHLDPTEKSHHISQSTKSNRKHSILSGGHTLLHLDISMTWVMTWRVRLECHSAVTSRTWHDTGVVLNCDWQTTMSVCSSATRLIRLDGFWRWQSLISHPVSSWIGLKCKNLIITLVQQFKNYASIRPQRPRLTQAVRWKASSENWLQTSETSRDVPNCSGILSTL